MRTVALVVALVASSMAHAVEPTRLSVEQLRNLARDNVDARMKAQGNKIKYVALMDVCGKSDIGDRLFKTIPTNAVTRIAGTPEDMAVVRMLIDSYSQGAYAGLREGWEFSLSLPEMREPICSTGVQRAIELTHQSSK